MTWKACQRGNSKPNGGTFLGFLWFSSSIGIPGFCIPLHTSGDRCRSSRVDPRMGMDPRIDYVTSEIASLSFLPRVLIGDHDLEGASSLALTHGEQHTHLSTMDTS